MLLIAKPPPLKSWLRRLSTTSSAGAVVDYITEYGWLRQTLGTENGPVCLVGAISAVCTGDPRKGYALLSGYADADGKTPASIAALGHALEHEDTFPRNSVVYGDERKHVFDSAITDFNDQSLTVEDALLPFKKIAGRI